MGVNVCELWESGNFREKRRVQALMFPEGVICNREKEGCRAQSVNTFLSLIALFSEKLREIKKGKTGAKPVFPF